jgi:hypothetical protein
MTASRVAAVVGSGIKWQDRHCGWRTGFNELLSCSSVHPSILVVVKRDLFTKTTIDNFGNLLSTNIIVYPGTWSRRGLLGRNV